MLQDRRNQMIDMITRQRTVTNEQLMETFDISIETVRRDLKYLEQHGHLRRVYGGAVLNTPMGGDASKSNSAIIHTGYDAAPGTLESQMVPPAGYSSLEGPFKEVIDFGKGMIADGTLLDFSTFQVQPWLDIPNIGSTVIAIADDEETAKAKADALAQALFTRRNLY